MILTTCFAQEEVMTLAANAERIEQRITALSAIGTNPGCAFA
jgi:hypothetical protein